MPHVMQPFDIFFTGGPHAKEGAAADPAAPKLMGADVDTYLRAKGAQDTPCTVARAPRGRPAGR